VNPIPSTQTAEVDVWQSKSPEEKLCISSQRSAASLKFDVCVVLTGFPYTKQTEAEVIPNCFL
jgi:hypothetical protein